MAVAPTGAEIAGLQPSASGRSLHLRLAALAMRKAAKQIAGGWPAKFDSSRPRTANFLNPIEELLLDERLVESADLLAAVAASGDISAVGGVAEHLAYGVSAEPAPALTARVRGA